MSTDLYKPLSEFIATNILKQSERVITPDEKLLSSGLIDSFSLVDLSIFIEDTFNVRIDDTELNADTFDSISELTALIKQRQ
jgi:acyl carrier protein